MKYLALLVWCSLASPVLAGINDKVYGDVLVTEVTSIYDGDTFRATIKDWPAIIGERIPIRVQGIDTPELRGKCDAEKRLARQAKQFTVEKLRSAKKIELRNIQRGKYFRLLADVYLDNQSLGAQLIKNQLAVPYSGGAKVNWCL
ncbi:MAG: thermonuclease family protein [Ketobacteraceae bacterium]|nr:thermonuclease family protein [Ketobacteraceae bacterium]